MAVRPPLIQWTTWWTWQNPAGRSQPGYRQPPSRAMTARRMAGGGVRRDRPASSGRPSGPVTTRLTSQSHSMRSMSRS
jgi:hypothetical protein